MSYMEIVWLVGLSLTFLGSLILAVEYDCVPLLCLYLIYIMLFGFFPYMYSNVSNEFQITSKQEIIPKLINLDNKRLNIITDNYTHYTFDTFEDINKWKNGGKFYHVTSYKKCFGPDENQSNVIIE